MKEAETLLKHLRWKEDTVVTNHEGERVWLKPCVEGGVQIGITDCCLESHPCERHAKMVAGGST